MNPGRLRPVAGQGVAMAGGIEVYLETLRSASRGGVGDDVLRALRRAEAARRGIDDAALDVVVRGHLIAGRAALAELERLHGVAVPAAAPVSPPDPAVAEEAARPAFMPVARWTVVTSRYVAANGLAMDFVGSCEALVADGRRFGSDAADPVMAMRLAREAARGVVQVYRLLDGGTALGCGEILVRGGVLVPVRTVTRSGWPSGCDGAAMEFAAAVSRGDVETALVPEGDRFVPRRHGLAAGT